MKRLKSKKSKEEVKVENKPQDTKGSEETDAPKGAWYATGKEGEQKAKAKQEELDREYNAPRRVWIKPGNEILVTFLDDVGFYFTEHNLYKNGRFGWTYTSLVPGSRILTEDGAIPIEDIKIGQKVLTHKGRFRKVTATNTHSTEKDIVTIQCGRVLTPIQGTYDHKVFYVPKPEGADGSRRVDTYRDYLDTAPLKEGFLEDVNVHDYMFVPKLTESIESDITPDFAWVLGLYAANGCTNGGVKHDYGICITLPLYKTEETEKAVDILREEGYNAFYKTRKNVHRLMCGSPDGKAIAARFRSLCGNSTFVKELPNEVMLGSMEVCEAALEGLMCGDGHLYEEKNMRVFVSTSFKLAMQCFQLSLKTGKIPSFRYQSVNDGIRHDFYTVYWTENSSKQVYCHMREDGMLVKVINKHRRTYEGLVHDLTVDEDHSFTVDGIAVKNCLGDYDNCPMCDAGFKPAPVCAFTVIDHSKFKSKKGKVYQNQKRLLVVKSRALEKLKDRRKEAGGLKYKVVRLKRFSDKESVTGEDFMVKRAEPWSIKKLLSFVPTDLKSKDEIKKWLKPYDYMEIFKPFSAEKLRRLLPGGGGPPPIGSSEDVGNFGTVDDDLEQYLK